MTATRPPSPVSARSVSRSTTKTPPWRFYSGTLGFTVLRDNPTPNGGRWIELAPGGDRRHRHT